ncbi:MULTISPECIES: hypothetical protein [Marinobacter]|jgi:hypothetical protein|uniref:hypothetical protein n=1 Tax=Marinobacter TaxID=2742 RepID=UPI0007D98EE0|nr:MULTISPECIES: hypothetical protein [Marinobacter]MCD1649385.1 hypothetical protein [Marinobacter adhaerens]
MKTVLSLITLLALATGCSHRAVYENVRINQRNDCADEPPPTYFECLERANKSFEEYQRERKDLLENPESDGKLP